MASVANSERPASATTASTSSGCPQKRDWSRVRSFSMGMDPRLTAVTSIAAGGSGSSWSSNTALQHVAPISRQCDLQQHPREAGARFDNSDQAAGSQVEPAEDSLPKECCLPFGMVGGSGKRSIVGQHIHRLADRPEDQCSQSLAR